MKHKPPLLLIYKAFVKQNLNKGQNLSKVAVLQKLLRLWLQVITVTLLLFFSKNETEVMALSIAFG